MFTRPVALSYAPIIHSSEWVGSQGKLQHGGKAIDDAKVRALSAPGHHADSGNLCLSISRTGSKSWIFRLRGGGEAVDVGLGSYRNVSLAGARRLAAECEEVIAVGADPRDRRDKGKPKRFGEVADQYLEENAAS